MKIFLNAMMITRKHFWRSVLPAALVLFPLATASAQPINDSLKSISLRNEKMYRMLNQMDDKGSSYEFTNVVAWKITDPDLYAQIEKVYRAQYGDKELKDFDVNSIYVFSSPVANDRYEPFHVLFMGKKVSTDTSGEGDFEFGGKKRAKSGQTVPRAFKGRDVIRLMHRQPNLLDNINAIQGEIVELPGDIMPRGVQLIKNSTERYVFHQMFTGFYSKRQIID